MCWTRHTLPCHSRHVTHYELEGETFTRKRPSDLVVLVVTTIRTRDLAGMSVYSEEIAVERFNDGFDISEVQMAFNSLEEAPWRRVVSAEPPDDLAEAIGLLTTVSWAMARTPSPASTSPSPASGTSPRSTSRRCSPERPLSPNARWRLSSGTRSAQR